MVWGVLQAGVALALLAAGGLDALQAVIIVAALPFAILLVAVIMSLHKVLSAAHLDKQREERELRRAGRRWLERDREQDGELPREKPDPPVA